MNKQINILVTKRNEPVLQEVSDMAKLHEKKNKFTATLIEMVELGLCFHKKGYRFMGGELVKIQREND